jgi:hypothetical protein
MLINKVLVIQCHAPKPLDPYRVKSSRVVRYEIPLVLITHQILSPLHSPQRTHLLPPPLHHHGVQ